MSPDRFEQHLVAGGDLLRRNEVAAARVELAAALEVRPHDIKALGLFGLACFRQSAFDDALPVYEKLVQLRPDDASHRLNLGWSISRWGSRTARSRSWGGAASSTQASSAP